MVAGLLHIIFGHQDPKINTPRAGCGRFFDSTNRVRHHPWHTATIKRAMLSSHCFGDGSLGAFVTLGRRPGLMK